MGSGPAPGAAPALTPLARRSAGPVEVRTFTQPLYSAGACDRLNDQCPPAWCESTGSLVTELSTEGMAADVTSSVIGLAPNSSMSVLSGDGVGLQPAVYRASPVPSGLLERTGDGTVVGAAEGSPVHLELVRVAPDVAAVRLQTPGGTDTTSPVKGLAALAVPGAAPGGHLTAFDAAGKPLADVALPAVPTALGPQCQAQPPALPQPGRQPADPAAAEQTVRAAFSTAFTYRAGAPTYGSLDAVEGGAALHPAFDLLSHNFPEAVRTSSVTTGTLVFTSPTSAVLIFTLSYSGGAAYGTRNGEAVLEGGSWLVARSTYCTVLSYGGSSCPS